jgi:lipid A 4'-phosphatase
MARYRGIAVYVALFVLAAIVFDLFPQTDLWASAQFYRGGFFLSDRPVLQFVYHFVFYVTDALSILLPLALLVILLRRRPLLGLTRLSAIFLIAALAIGPGVVVNSALKDHWGRARPSQILQFGGTKQFTPPLEPTDQCDRNCSFPAGHPATGFYFVAFALLIPAARSRRVVFAASLAAGLVIGLVRMGQGGHFLSDVVFSGLIVVGVVWLLYRLIVQGGGIAGLPSAWRLPAIGAICFLIGATSYFLYDRPEAIFASKLPPTVHHVFAVVTQFGKAEYYLIGTAIIFAVAFVLGRTWRIWAWRAGFVFINVAASGIAVDIVKVIVARARPPLFLHGGEFGFEWFRTDAAHWSFPSGHSATVTSLALSLMTIWPRLWPLWWFLALLVIASRLALDAHYPSDVLGGFFFALMAWWGCCAVFSRRNLPLRETP